MMRIGDFRHAKNLGASQADAAELTRKERFQLAHDLLDDCDEDAESPAEIEAAWDAEIQK